MGSAFGEHVGMNIGDAERLSHTPGGADALAGNQHGAHAYLLRSAHR